MLTKERKPKDKASMRFKQVNFLCDYVLRNLPNTSCGLVLLVCWRHADEDGFFCLAVSRIAQSTGKSERQIQRTMTELQKVGVISLEKPAIGTRAPTYRITGNSRGDIHDTPTSAKPTG